MTLLLSVSCVGLMDISTTEFVSVLDGAALTVVLEKIRVILWSPEIFHTVQLCSLVLTLCIFLLLYRFEIVYMVTEVEINFKNLFYEVFSVFSVSEDRKSNG